MKRGTLFGMLALLAALLAGPAGALAGGWATVTLDSLPAEVRAGEAFEIGFTVRQHGDKPTNQVEPTVALTDPATKQSIYFKATQQGAAGHFVATVTVPAAGAWEWEIIPAPFAGTQLVALSVAPPAPAKVAPAAGPA